MVSLSVEHAKSGRASCKTCRQKIGKGEIRWVKTSESEAFGTVKAYSHLECLKLSKKSLKDLEFENIEFDGDFSKEETKEVKKAWKECIAALTQSPAKKRSKTESKDGSPKKKKRKTKKKSGVEVEYNEKGELTEEEKLRKKYSQMAVSQLKDYLRANNQMLSGKKAELVEKCVDGELYGALPHCSVCNEGRLKKAPNGSIVCSGYYDEDCGMRISCDFNAENDSVKRVPWKGPDEVEAEELSKEESTSWKEAVSNQMQKVLSKMFSSELNLKPKEIAEKLVEFARTNKVEMPKDNSLARQKVGSLLMQNRKDDNTFDIIAVYQGLVDQFGVSSAKGAASEDTPSEPEAKNAANTEIANLLQKLAHLTAKTGGNPFKIRALKKSVIAIRGLDFKIESGKQVSTGKQKVPGIGKGTAKVIDEYLETGEVSHIKELEEAAASQDMVV